MPPPILAPSLTPRLGRFPGCLSSWRHSTSARHTRHVPTCESWPLPYQCAHRCQDRGHKQLTLHSPLGLQGSTLWTCSGLPTMLESGARVTSFGLQSSYKSASSARLHGLMSRSITRPGRRPLPIVPATAPSCEVNIIHNLVFVAEVWGPSVAYIAPMVLQMQLFVYETEWQSSCPAHARLQRQPLGRRQRSWALYTPDGHFARSRPRVHSRVLRSRGVRCQGSHERMPSHCGSACCAALQALQTGIRQAVLVGTGAISTGTSSFQV